MRMSRPSTACNRNQRVAVSPVSPATRETRQPPFDSHHVAVTKLTCHSYRSACHHITETDTQLHEQEQRYLAVSAMRSQSTIWRHTSTLLMYCLDCLQAAPVLHPPNDPQTVTRRSTHSSIASSLQSMATWAHSVQPICGVKAGSGLPLSRAVSAGATFGRQPPLAGSCQRMQHIVLSRKITPVCPCNSGCCSCSNSCGAQLNGMGDCEDGGCQNRRRIPAKTTFHCQFYQSSACLRGSANMAPAHSQGPRSCSSSLISHLKWERQAHVKNTPVFPA